MSTVILVAQTNYHCKPGLLHCAIVPLTEYLQKSWHGPMRL